VRTGLPRALICVLLAAAGGFVPAMAAAHASAHRPARSATADPIPPGVRVPAWHELTSTQRHDLVRLERRWDSLPASRRVAILERWQRWQAASPEQRETLRRGARNFHAMSPPLRAQMRRSLAAVAELPPAEQRRVRAIWRHLSPAQRRAWLLRGGPGFAPPPR
jgi:hypothetical protein